MRKEMRQRGNGVLPGIDREALEYPEDILAWRALCRKNAHLRLQQESHFFIIAEG